MKNKITETASGKKIIRKDRSFNQMYKDHGELLGISRDEYLLISCFNTLALGQKNVTSIFMGIESGQEIHLRLTYSAVQKALVKRINEISIKIIKIKEEKNATREKKE